MPRKLRESVGMVAYRCNLKTKTRFIGCPQTICIMSHILQVALKLTVAKAEADFFLLPSECRDYSLCATLDFESRSSCVLDK